MIFFYITQICVKPLDKEEKPTPGEKTKKKAVLHELINAYRKTNPPKVELLEKIIEVQRLDRNISAHGTDEERHQLGKKEADHSLTAIRIVLKELLNIEYKPLIEKS